MVKLCPYHEDSLGWCDCTEGFIGCQVEKAREEAEGKDICYSCGKVQEYGTMKSEHDDDFAIFCKTCKPDLYKEENMTVYELVQQLNEHASKPEFVEKLSKVHTHDKFHNLVKEEFDQFIKDFDLRIGLWELYLGGDYHRVAIKYNRTFVEYKNCKYSSRGNFSDLKFMVAEGYAKVLVSDLAERFKKDERKEKIQNLTKAIKEAETMANRFRKELASLFKEAE